MDIHDLRQKRWRALRKVLYIYTIGVAIFIGSMISGFILLWFGFLAIVVLTVSVLLITWYTSKVLIRAEKGLEKLYEKR